MSVADHSRIVVLGTSCCGKTTLCRELARSMGRPHIELDQLYWGPQWTPRADFEERVELAIAAEQWIADGNYSKVRAAIWTRATALIWLNYSFPIVLWRALRRTCIRIATRQELFAGNRESILQSFFHHDGIPWWVVRTFHRRQRELRQLFKQPEYLHLELFELRRPEEAAAMAAAVSARPQATAPGAAVEV